MAILAQLSLLNTCSNWSLLHPLLNTFADQFVYTQQISLAVEGLSMPFPSSSNNNSLACASTCNVDNVLHRHMHIMYFQFIYG